jgi:hypothetical protein
LAGCKYALIENTIPNNFIFQMGNDVLSTTKTRLQIRNINQGCGWVITIPRALKFQIGKVLGSHTKACQQELTVDLKEKITQE